MITYRETHTYKYILEDNYRLELPSGFNPGLSIDTKFINIMEGTLFINLGYRWDGPSGPTIDSKNFMRGSLVHDALYQLMREGFLPQDFRKKADQLLKQHCKEDGMSFLRRNWVYLGVRAGGKSAAKKRERNPILTAP